MMIGLLLINSLFEIQLPLKLKLQCWVKGMQPSPLPPQAGHKTYPDCRKHVISSYTFPCQQISD